MLRTFPSALMVLVHVSRFGTVDNIPVQRPVLNSTKKLPLQTLSSFWRTVYITYFSVCTAAFLEYTAKATLREAPTPFSRNNIPAFGSLFPALLENPESPLVSQEHYLKTEVSRFDAAPTYLMSRADKI